MLASIRQVGNIRIGCDNVITNLENGPNQDILRSLFEALGASFKQIELINCCLSEHTLKVLLFRTPNVETLLFKYCTAKRTKEPTNYLKVKAPLKSLTMIYCDSEFQFIALAMKPESIETFHFKSYGYQQILAPFFLKQKKIKRLLMNIPCDLINSQSKAISELQLEELSLGINGYTGDQAAFFKIIFQQASFLTVLDLTWSRVTDAVFAKIVGITKLKSLKLLVNEVSISVFKNVSKLVMLEKLTVMNNIANGDDQHLVILSHIKNLLLTKLEIKYPCIAIQDVVFYRWAENARNITSLSINGIVSVAIISSIVHTMFNLTELKLQGSQKYDPSSQELKALEVGFYLHTNLRVLSLRINTLEILTLTYHMFLRYPSVEKLELETSLKDPELTKFIAFVLRNCLCLREFKLFNNYLVFIDNNFANMLNSHAPRLKHVSLNAKKQSQVQSTIHGMFSNSFRKVELNGEYLQLDN